MTTYCLYLDDIRMPEQSCTYMQDLDYRSGKWVIVRSYEEFCAHVTKEHGENNSFPSIISFDHDLCNLHYSHTSGTIPYETFEEKTGYDCAKWLIGFCIDKGLDLPRYKIHSMNPVGKENIEMVLKNYTKYKNQITI